MIKVTVNSEQHMVVPDIEVGENKITILDGKGYAGTIELKKENGIITGHIDMTCTALPWGRGYLFKAEDTIYIDIRVDFIVKNILSNVMYNANWSKPSFDKNFTQIQANTQNILIESENSYYNVLPLFCNDFLATITSSESSEYIRFSISPMYFGGRKINGCFMILCEAQDPYKVIEKSYDYAISKKYIASSLKKNKKYPEMFEYFGWCSWNAFYHGVSDEKLTQKLEEFKEKGIPAKWVLIDDGWSVAEQENWLISEFKEDKKKFPEGLSGFVKKAKKEYGIKYVGAWHSAMGYWLGIKEGSKLYEEQKDNLVKTNGDLYLPANGYEGTYHFFNKWHRYLKKCGIDFLKIDTQGYVLYFLKYINHACEKAISVTEALENSVNEVFSSNLMNCMGNFNINNLNHTYTNLSRSSDDFFPKKEDGFINHIMQNVYSSVFMNYLVWCDFDMYWSNHFDAKRNSVLRAISGGPIYISDELGESDIEYIKPLITEDGKILRCDNSARPTRDCLFTDNSDGIMKVYNTVGENGVVAAFNFGKDAKVTVSIADFDGVGEYYAYLYFAKKFIKTSSIIEFYVAENDCEIINFYPIKDDTCMVGDLTKYISSATEKNELLLREN